MQEECQASKEDWASFLRVRNPEIKIRVRELQINLVTPCLSCPGFMLFIEQQRLLQAHGGSKELGPHQQASVTRSQASAPKELARKTHLHRITRLNNWELLMLDHFL